MKQADGMRARCSSERKEAGDAVRQGTSRCKRRSRQCESRTRRVEAWPRPAGRGSKERRRTQREPAEQRQRPEAKRNSSRGAAAVASSARRHGAVAMTVVGDNADVPQRRWQAVRGGTVQWRPRGGGCGGRRKAPRRKRGPQGPVYAAGGGATGDRPRAPKRPRAQNRGGAGGGPRRRGAASGPEAPGPLTGWPAARPGRRQGRARRRPQASRWPQSPMQGPGRRRGRPPPQREPLPGRTARWRRGP